jgi:hypothetical protein
MGTPGDEKDLSISILFLSYCVGYLSAKNASDTANAKDTDVFYMVFVMSIHISPLPFPPFTM